MTRYIVLCTNHEDGEGRQTFAVNQTNAAAAIAKAIAFIEQHRLFADKEVGRIFSARPNDQAPADYYIN